MTTAFWIAHGENYILEAQASAQSFKAHHPGCNTLLCGDRPADGFDLFRFIGLKRDPWYLYSLGEMAALLDAVTDERLLYFDTDTCILDNLDDLIALIGRFDVIGAHAPARQTAPTIEPVPDAFPELNIGVLALLNSAAVRRVLHQAVDAYCAHSDVYGDNDQAPLREALWNSDLSVYAMPPEYNCRFGFGGFAALPVKVLHQRGYPFEQAAQYLNGRRGMRSWKREDLP